ncbi:MAG: DnaJ domain-containing protein [Thermodesulfobacteriota bacterium]|nr:DnaJ domain-containing protein [Thermodesulfobacteriota bacterium]
MTKVILSLLGILYALSPWDLFPDFIIGWGWIDDIIIIGLLWYYFFSPSPEKHTEQAGLNGDKEREDAGPSAFGQDNYDPYKMLGLDRDASKKEIDAAYKKLAQKYHPDKVSHLGEEFRELAEKRFKEIHEAHERLK